MVGKPSVRGLVAARDSVTNVRFVPASLLDGACLVVLGLPCFIIGGASRQRLDLNKRKRAREREQAGPLML